MPRLDFDCLDFKLRTLSRRSVPHSARASAAAKANPAAIDVYSRATATSAARAVALYGLFGPSEAEKRAEQARLDAEQEALNERFRKESESDFAFMSVFGVVTSLPIVYLIYLAFQVDPEEVGAGGIY